MPAFQSSPINLIVPQLVPGKPEYVFGSYNSSVAATRMSVQTVAIASNICTLGVTVLEGNLPVVGQKVTVAATTTDSGAANVTNIAITAVSFNATTGAGTITFAAVGSDQVTMADSGYALAPQIEVGETLTSVATRAVSTQANTGPNNGRAVRFDFTFPSIPTAATVKAQSADFYDDAQFTDLSTVATVSGGVVTGGSLQITIERDVFVRFIISGVSGGTLPTGVGKILI